MIDQKEELDALPPFTVIENSEEGHYIKGRDGAWYELFTLGLDEDGITKVYKFQDGLTPDAGSGVFQLKMEVVSRPVWEETPGKLRNFG